MGQAAKRKSNSRPMSFYHSHQRQQDCPQAVKSPTLRYSILLGLLGLPKLSRNSTRLGSQKFAGIHLQQGFSGDLKWTEVKGYLLTSGTVR